MFPTAVSSLTENMFKFVAMKLWLRILFIFVRVMLYLFLLLIRAKFPYINFSLNNKIG